MIEFDWRINKVRRCVEHRGRVVVKIVPIGSTKTEGALLSDLEGVYVDLPEGRVLIGAEVKEPLVWVLEVGLIVASDLQSAILFCHVQSEGRAVCNLRLIEIIIDHAI